MLQGGVKGMTCGWCQPLLPLSGEGFLSRRLSCFSLGSCVTVSGQGVPVLTLPRRILQVLGLWMPMLWVSWQGLDVQHCQMEWMGRHIVQPSKWLKGKNKPGFKSLRSSWHSCFPSANQRVRRKWDRLHPFMCSSLLPPASTEHDLPEQHTQSNSLLPHRLAVDREQGTL